MIMKTGKQGRDLVKLFEGYRSTAYRCPAGVWTIGWGHTKGVTAGQYCTRADAERFLSEDLADAEGTLNRFAEAHGLTLNQCQFDALVSFIYNVGAGNWGKSTLRKLVAQDPGDPYIRYQFSRWVYGGGKELPGLVRRRKAEADLYFQEPT